MTNLRALVGLAALGITVAGCGASGEPDPVGSPDGSTGRSSLGARIDANERRIEDAGAEVLSYIAPGNEHTVLSDGGFYTEAVNGERLVDWVSTLIGGEPVEDVHCRRCRAG